MIVLHISDTHFGTEKPPVVEALRRLAHEKRPDVLIFSGDITQRARPEEFAAARSFVASLEVPRMLSLPGNHDIPLFNVAARLLHPYKSYLDAFGPTLEPTIELPELLVLGVNTTRWKRHKDGEVAAVQVQRSAARLSASRREQLRIVVVHQPAAVIRAEDESDRLHGADPALQQWSASGADLVLGGHIHLPYVVECAAVATPTPRKTWVVQAGTAVSDRVRHGTCNSVNLIHWRRPAPGAVRTCRVERYDYHSDPDAFGVAETRVLALD